MTEPRQYKSAAAFRSSIDAQLRRQAAALGPPATLTLLRRRFLQERFLARVFAAPESPWLLKGGIGMLVRNPPLARFSRDIDLVHRPADDPNHAADELAELIGVTMDGDFLRFQLGKRRPASTEEGLTVVVDAYVGTALWEQFPVDISCEVHFVGPTEPRQHVPVLSDAGLPLPPFVLYPVADQVADKVGAMYERHGESGESASNRWRDLADLVLLVLKSDGLNAATLTEALDVRVQRARSPRHLPASMTSPGPEWETGYPPYAAASTRLPEQFHELDTALRLVGGCLDPILAGDVTRARWDPTGHHWAT